MSRRRELAQEIGMLASQWQDEVQRFDAAAGAFLELNATDMRCASLLQHGPMTASELANGTGLTRGAVTTVIDRLEKQGVARRKDDPADRRRVQVELTPHARKTIETLWGPMVLEGAAMMQRYTVEELELVKGFLLKVRAIQQAHIARVEAMIR